MLLMGYNKINFPNEDGQQLAAYLDLPIDGKPKAFALFAHCFTCNKNLKAVANISRSLTQQGIAVMRFDFTGLGESEGDFADTNFSSNVEDLKAAAGYLANEYEAPSLLIGHSLGGAAVLLAANSLPSVKAVVTIGAPADPTHVTNHFEGTIEDIKTHGKAKVNIGGRTFQIKKQFLDDLEASNLTDHIKNLDTSLLIMHSPSDKVVGIDNAAKIYQAAMHPKSYISLEGMDHLMSEKQDSQYVGQVISQWASRYIDQASERDLETEYQVVTRTGRTRFTTDAKAGHHHLLADEPESAGGQDLGPNPYDYLAIALGSCTSMTLRMYADHKNWDLDEVKVHVQHKKVHCDDCNDADNKHSKIDVLDRIIEVKGKLDEKQKERLVQIADKCPVHKTLNSDIKVQTTLKE